MSHSDDESLFDVDICATLLTKTPPRLPLREEIPSLGFEVIYKAAGVGVQASKHEAHKAARAYCQQLVDKELKKRRIFSKGSNRIKEKLKERKHVILELQHSPRALSYEAYEQELQQKHGNDTGSGSGCSANVEATTQSPGSVSRVQKNRIGRATKQWGLLRSDTNKFRSGSSSCGESKPSSVEVANRIEYTTSQEIIPDNIAHTDMQTSSTSHPLPIRPMTPSPLSPRRIVPSKQPSPKHDTHYDEKQPLQIADYDICIISASGIGAAIARELSKYNITSTNTKLSILWLGATDSVKSNSGIVYADYGVKHRLCRQVVDIEVQQQVTSNSNSFKFQIKADYCDPEMYDKATAEQGKSNVIQLAYLASMIVIMSLHFAALRMGVVARPASETGQYYVAAIIFFLLVSMTFSLSINTKPVHRVIPVSELTEQAGEPEGKSTAAASSVTVDDRLVGSSGSHRCSMSAQPVSQEIIRCNYIINCADDASDSVARWIGDSSLKLQPRLVDASKKNPNFIHVAIDSPGFAGSSAIALEIVSSLLRTGLSLTPSPNTKKKRADITTHKGGLNGHKIGPASKNGSTDGNIQAQTSHNGMCKCEHVTELEVLRAYYRSLPIDSS